MITAVERERDAVMARLDPAASVLGPFQMSTATTPAGRVDAIAAGVGSVAAATATATALALASYDLVLSAGIGGGFAPLAIGQAVLASEIVVADFGAQGPDGFIPADRLELGPIRWAVDDALAAGLTERVGARAGVVITVSTVTGTTTAADELAERFPGALAEAMEGAGVAVAATVHGVPFAELRTISNLVGPRDRSAWQLEPALAALTEAMAAIVAAPLDIPRDLEPS